MMATAPCGKMFEGGDAAVRGHAENCEYCHAWAAGHTAALQDNKLRRREMGDPTRGLYDKFEVFRNDESDGPGGKHYGCEYFVLDPDHDPHAAPALEAYAASCEKDYPLLARDLRKKALAMRDASASDDGGTKR